MRRTVHQRRRGTEIDVKMMPMIDVIFQLQIFFLCTTGFAMHESILPTKLPQPSQNKMQAVAEPQNLEIVHVRLRGTRDSFRIELNRRPIAGFDELLTDLRKVGTISAELPVVLDIGGEVVLGNVVRVYDGCLAAGFLNVNFATTDAPAR